MPLREPFPFLAVPGDRLALLDGGLELRRQESVHDRNDPLRAAVTTRFVLS
jgi:hypothetical protein